MKSKVIKATATIFILTLIAKLLGFVKSIVQALYFGATLETDIFNVAQGFVANILYMLTAAIATSFVPIYIQKKKEGEIESRKFASRAITFLTIGIIGVAVALFFLGEPIMKMAAPAYSGNSLDCAVLYFRVLLLGVVFSLGASLYQQLLNAEKVYGFSAFASVVNSIVILFCIILLEETIGIWALIVATLISYVAQFCIVYVRGHKFGNYTFRYGIWDNALKILILQSMPILISQATVEINQVIDRALLVGVGEGALTAASYASTLWGLINGLVTIPISTVLFTELSEAGARRDKKRIGILLSTTYEILVLICLPIMIVIFFCSTECVDTIYGYGNYCKEAIEQTAIALKMYGYCTLSNAIYVVLTKAYYGLNDTKRPMVFGVLNVLTNIIASIILSHYYGIKGVVGGTAVAINIWTIIMLINFNKKHVQVYEKNILKVYWKFFFSGAVAAIIMYVMKDVFFVNLAVTLCIKICITFGCYGVLLLALRERMLWKIIRQGSAYFKHKLNNIGKQ